MVAANILDFQNLKILTVGRLERVEMRRSAKFGQNRSNCSRDMTIFRFSKMAAAAIFQIFNGQWLQECQTASPCQIWSKSLKRLPRYGDFLFFQDGGRPPSWICCVGV